MRGAHRRPSSGAAPDTIVTELSPAEKAAALSRLGDAAPSGVPLDADRLDAARARLRAAVAPPAVQSSAHESAASPVDPAAFAAAQARLRAAAPARPRKR